MHIVIVSSGHVALRFASELSDEFDVCVVHDGDEGRADLEGMDIELIEGSGNDVEALKRAGTERAAYFIACSQSDEINIIACLLAKRLGEPSTICFVEKRVYLRAFGAGEDEGEATAPDLGIDRLVWPAWQLATRIEEILLVPGATDVGSFARGQIKMLEFRMTADLPIIGKPLAEIRTLPPGVLVAGVTRDGEWSVPRGASVLCDDDRVLFIGRAKAMRKLAAWFSENLGEAASGEIVIVGGGAVGYQLALRMEEHKSSRVKLIERDADRCERIATALERTLVLEGDGSDLNLLDAERVREAQALVTVTDSDEKNLLVSLIGHQMGIPKVITRVSSSGNRRVFEQVGIDVPLTARGAATEFVLHTIRHENVDLLATVGEGQVEVVRVAVAITFHARTLKDVKMPPDAIVAAVLHEGQAATVPSGDSRVVPQDRLIVICRAERVAEVRETFSK